MPFRRTDSRRPVNSIKHILDSEGQLSGGTLSRNDICVAVPNVDTSTFKPGDVRVGATVNAFFLSIFMLGATGGGAQGSLNWYIIKLHFGQSVPNPAGTGVSEVRNQIIHEEKGLAGSADGTPMAFRGVIKVPRGMRRMREGDAWAVVLRAPSQGATDVEFCVKAIYKSFF